MVHLLAIFMIPSHGIHALAGEIKTQLHLPASKEVSIFPAGRSRVDRFGLAVGLFPYLLAQAWPSPLIVIVLNGLSRNPMLQRQAVQKFHRNETSSVMLTYCVDRADIWMVEGGRSACFPPKAFQRLRVFP